MSLLILNLEFIVAGIEKICEFSGEYGYGDMYNYKRNLIQILPKFKKEFRLAGDRHSLYILEKDSDTCIVSSVKRGTRYAYVDSFDYLLQVYDSELQGNVNGSYLNSFISGDKGKVFRKIKRLLGAKRLNIKNIPLSMREVFKLLGRDGDYYDYECIYLLSLLNSVNTKNDLENAVRLTMLSDGYKEKKEKNNKFIGVV